MFLRDGVGFSVRGVVSSSMSQTQGLGQGEWGVCHGYSSPIAMFSMFGDSLPIHPHLE